MLKAHLTRRRFELMKKPGHSLGLFDRELV